MLGLALLVEPWDRNDRKFAVDLSERFEVLAIADPTGEALERECARARRSSSLTSLPSVRNRAPRD